MLTQFVVMKAKQNAKPYKLADALGLHMLVKATSARLWRFRYRFAGKENSLGFGSFPEVSLAEARAKRDDARKLLAAGVDPSQKKKEDRAVVSTAAQNTFGAIAAEHLGKLEADSKADATMAKNRWLLEESAAPLSNRPITQIKPIEVLNLLRKIERTGRRETAHRLRGAIGSVFRLAIVTSRAETDPTAALRGALLQPKTKHRASITDEKELGALMRSIDDVLAFELFASGMYTLGTLGAELWKRGFRSREDKQLSLAQLARMLRNPFYIGLTRTDHPIHREEIGLASFTGNFLHDLFVENARASHIIFYVPVSEASAHL